MLEQFSHIIVAIIVGLAAPLLAKYVEFRLEDKKKRLNEQREARKELIQQCLEYVSGPKPFYRNKEFMDKYYPRIKRHLSDQLIQDIEGGEHIFNLPCKSMEESHGKTIEVKDQITEKFKNELAELESKWNLT